MNLEKYLENFKKSTDNPSLDAMKWLMNEFRNPHKAKGKFIHVAGTNGKGSVCEMLSNILVKQGYTVGKFMSPYLINCNEDIAVNNKYITDDEIDIFLPKLADKIDEYNSKNKIKVTWFEVMTALAYIFFDYKKCDFVILETGLGGMYDCTNIVENPIMSIITTIGYDHMNVLGNTIEQITSQKAGIIKPNSDTVMCSQQKPVIDIIKEECSDKNNTLHLIKDEDISDYSVKSNIQTFSYNSFNNIEVNLKGKKQINNATICIECLEILKNKGYEISENSLREGLKTVIHKARFETICDKPIVIYDGGHNENAITNLMNTIDIYYNNLKRAYIISILKTKDYKTILKLLSMDKNAVFYLTSGNDIERYISKETLYEEISKYVDKSSVIKAEIEDALRSAISDYSDRAIFVVGSFYVYKTVLDCIRRIII